MKPILQPQFWNRGIRVMAGLVLFGLWSAGLAHILAAEAPPPKSSARLDRTKLLLYRNASGAIVPVNNAEEWQHRNTAILAGMQEVMGPLPGKEKRSALDVEIQEETDCGSYIRRFLTYSPEPKGRIPAYLLIPKEALASGKQFPAVLCLHQTHALGQKVVVGLGNSPGDEYGVELAKQGYVCLAPAYPRLANYQPDLKGLGYQSGTMKAIWDNIRGMDLLDSLPFVKPGKFGAIGHSLGGHNAIFTAVFDDRIKVVASSCGFDSFLDYKGGDIKGWTSDRYMPKLLQYRLEEIPFDFHELIGALAPRACFVSAPFYDDNFKWRSVHQIAEAAAKVYQLHGAEARLRVEHPNCSHEFPKEMRELAYQLFGRELR
jgi:dienelactone hydrolase